MILDSYGKPTSSRNFLEGSSQSRQRPWQSPVNKDIDDLVSELDFATIVNASRRLFSNNGQVKAIIEQKSSYSVGNAFLPIYRGKEKAWSEQAEEWILNWYEICDVRGGIFDLQTVLYLSSVSVDLNGDAFILLTSGSNGFPMIQCVPAHRIGQRERGKIVETGRYKGLKITKGIISSKVGRPVAYRFLADDEKNDQDIPAQNMLHIYDPSFVSQARGLPLFSHCINQFRDLAKSQENELMAQLINSTIAFVEHNEFGGIDPDDITQNYDPETGEPSCQSFENGTIRFFKAGSGAKIEQVENNRPSVNYQLFNERVTKACIVGTGWSAALIGLNSGNTGTISRTELLIAKKAIQDRQNLLKPFLKKIVNYALGSAIDNGILPPSKGWWNWDFSTDQTLSIDLGRDSAALRADYDKGLKNLSQILGDEGRSLEAHLRERAHEEALEIQIRNEFKLPPKNHDTV